MADKEKPVEDTRKKQPAEDCRQREANEGYQTKRSQQRIKDKMKRVEDTSQGETNTVEHWVQLRYSSRGEGV